jgi:hypothetical protein
VVGPDLARARRLGRGRHRLPGGVRGGGGRGPARAGARPDAGQPRRRVRPLPRHLPARVRRARALGLAPRAHPALRGPRPGRCAAHLRRSRVRRRRHALGRTPADDDGRERRPAGPPAAPRTCCRSRKTTGNGS